MSEKKGIYVGLVHYPVYNKHKEVVVASITTIDIHDFSRIGRTYGIDKVYVVTPLRAQQELAHKMFSHWMSGYGAGYNPTRKEAISRIGVNNSVEEVIQEIESTHGKGLKVIITGAKAYKKCISYEEARELAGKEGPVLILFGTGWGLEKSLVERADFVLAPIQGNTDYNHLPVRAAAAIAIDRILGDRD